MVSTLARLDEYELPRRRPRIKTDVKNISIPPLIDLEINNLVTFINYLFRDS